jgi:hypothetical protein
MKVGDLARDEAFSLDASIHLNSISRIPGFVVASEISITLSFCPDNRSPSLLVSPRDNKDIGPLNETKDMSSKL